MEGDRLMGALDAWQRFLSGQQANLTRQQVAQYQGAIEERKLAQAYKMHKENLVVDQQKLASNLGFRYEQLNELTERWTADRNLRSSLNTAMKEKWGDEVARDVWKIVTNMSLQKERMQLAEQAAKRRDWVGVQKALGYVEDEDGNQIPTLGREKMDAQTAYQRDVLGQRGEGAEARNAYRSERLGQYDAGLRLRAAGMDAQAVRRNDKIPGKLWLNQSDLDSGRWDEFLLDEKPGWPTDASPFEAAALNQAKKDALQRRQQREGEAAGNQLIQEAQQRARAPRNIGPTLPTPKPIRVPRLPKVSGIPTPSEPEPDFRRWSRNAR